MKLLFKQFTKEILKNKIFVILMLIMSAFTSFMFFFVRFSIDGNLSALYALPSLNKNQTLYMNALKSNTILAFNSLLALSALSAFVYFMFFYRFFKGNKKQIGCLKSIGFKDRTLCSYLIVFTLVLSALGTIIGICSGYFASDVLISANSRSYFVTDLVKTINVTGILIGFFIPFTAVCIASLLSYGFIRGKEVGVLLAGVNNELKNPGLLRFIKTFSLRIALRKPVAVLLIIIASMSFTVMFVLGYSLNMSSGTVFKSQTEGHNYLYDTRYDEYLEQKSVDTDTQTYLSISGTLSTKGLNKNIEQQVVGLEPGKGLLSLVDEAGNPIALPRNNNVYISPALQEMYGFNNNDTIILKINGQNYEFTAHIAANAAKNCAYISKDRLAQILNLPEKAYNGALSMKQLRDGGTALTKKQRLDELDRAAVSNRTSAVINQVIGCLVGCILLFLALLVNFQDSTKDILILHLMGYKAKSIRKKLIDIYKPILWVSFFLTIWPGIMLTQSIQKSLSVQTGDYMPFQTNLLVIFIVFILLNVVYILVQSTFNIAIKRIIKHKNILEYINAN